MDKIEFELENKEIVTLSATFGICILAGLEECLPKTSVVKRRVMNVENAIKDLASLQGKCIFEETVQLAARVWNRAMADLQKELQDAATIN